MKPYLSDNDIIQNLKDAGCGDDAIQIFMDDLQRGNRRTGIQLLQKHRRCLLAAVHKEQKRIDCLDYLLFMLEKEQGRAAKHK